MTPNRTVHDNSVESCFALYLHFSSFFFPSETLRWLLRTINSRRYLRFIKAMRTIYPISCGTGAAFSGRLCPPKMWRTRHTVPPLELIPFRRVLRNYRESQKMCSVSPVIWSNTRGIENSRRMRKGGNRSCRVSKILLTLFSNLLDVTTEKTLIDIGGLKARSKTLFFPPKWYWRSCNCCTNDIYTHIHARAHTRTQLSM